MNTSLYIAKRYLFSKKSFNAINFISGISMLGVLVGSAALILILSVFNGFEQLILSMYNTFTPELRIEPAKGKTFVADGPDFKNLKAGKQVASYTEVLQEKALIRYNDGQYIGLVKGVSADFARQKGIDSAMIQGNFDLGKNGEPSAVIGSVVQSYLGVNIHDHFSTLELFSPRKGGGNAINPADEFIKMDIQPAGVFELQQQFDEMIIVPIAFARQLLDEHEGVSAIELNFKPGTSVSNYQEELSRKLGTQFVVKNRVQQNQLLYKILNTEKWAIFFILTFVLIIAIFNIIGSLTMLVMDKRKDIAILRSIGANDGLIRNIFFAEGMMISLVGCAVGIALGIVLALIQQHYGLIKMGGENMVVDAYPVSFRALDILLVFFTVVVISAIASGISSRLSVKQDMRLQVE
ncbi:ABC transporter permease (plasmid) [Pedobacter sp. BS3]|uniref:FtsX-like permease family protein n=1 Tax=Pedobacter sp. BS3 TaxID=2567937 RepID=UPI0011ED7A2D|nr:FtsX-like permease family protein [Pedobacter sp. BS3]TZF86091.1 ABC transporter permease [Pedobacter sp. BS3]